MVIILAPDKFKGSLNAHEVCQAISAGMQEVSSGLDIVSIPQADGGEGTADLLTRFCDGKQVNVKVLDPLFREIESSFGLSAEGTAFIEMSAASGLEKLKADERNPLFTTTYGTGQLIQAAIDHGAKEIVLGIGGSATNDAGIGMAQALGYNFLSETGEKLKPVGKNLVHIHSIQKNKTSQLDSIKFTVLCDVHNPLHGKDGAAFVFGSQKGASPADIQMLDAGLRHFEILAAKEFQAKANFPGAGAAGGLGAGAKVFLNARIESGFNFISKYTRLENKISQSDLVITGEGKLDDQSLSGKVVQGVARLAAQLGKPCVAFTGKNELSTFQTKSLGLTQVIALVDASTTPEESMKNASSLLKKRAGEFIRSFNFS